MYDDAVNTTGKKDSVAVLVQANNIESVVNSDILNVCIAKCACACL